MLKQHFIFFLVTLFCASIAFANDDFDTRLKKYKKESNWSIKSEMIIDLCLESESINYIDIRNEAEKLLDKGFTLNNEAYTNSSRFVIAFILNKDGKYDQALDLLFLCERYFQKIEDEKHLAYVKIAKGHSYYYKGLQKEAIGQYQDAKVIWERLDDKMEMNLSESLIANALIQLKEYKRAEEILKNCIEFILPTKKYRTISAYYSQLGELYSFINRKEDSRYNFSKGAEYALRSNDPGTIARAQNYLAIAKYYEGDVEKALELFKSSLAYRQKSGDYKLVCESYYNLGSLFVEEKKYEKAVEYFQLSINTAKNHQLLQDQADGLLELSNIYKAKGNLKEALDFLNQHLKMNELIKNQFIKEIDRETEVLSQLNQSDLNIKSNLREKILQNEIQLEKKKGNITLYLGLLMTIGMAIYIFKLKKGSN